MQETFGSDNSLERNYNPTYSFDAQHGYYQYSHKLYTSVSPSLYDYYRSKSHFVNGDNDYSKFVTPQAVKSIAENIRNLTRNGPNGDEEFANAVLTLVHQVPYVVSSTKYPVEALVDNSGDCDVTSLLAASIMIAGSLDVVLLNYRGFSPGHMNVGVYLPYTPVYHTPGMTPFAYDYDNKTYWTAESTPTGNWKVGDQPDFLAHEQPLIIPLENYEKLSPAHVPSSLDSPLIPSAISINLPLENLGTSENERSLTISGSISPVHSGKNVVMYVSQDGSSAKAFETVTDILGNYSLTWNVTSAGTYRLRTSWSDFSKYAGSDSETLTVFVGPYQPWVEGNVPSYYWSAEAGEVFARANAAGAGFFASQGVKEFLKSSLTGTNVSLSWEFIVLKSGQPAGSREQTITIPQKQISLGRRRFITLPEQTITVKESEQPNIQVGFILRNSGGNNYSASVGMLGDSDISQIAQRLDGNNTAFMNASDSIRESVRYHVVAKISEDQVSAELHDENGTLLMSTAAKDDAVGISESGILMTFDANNLIAFKNLKVESFDQPPTQSVESKRVPVNGLDSLAPYIGMPILLAAAIATMVYLKKRTKVRE
jgi:hypothetical protein